MEPEAWNIAIRERKSIYNTLSRVDDVPSDHLTGIAFEWNQVHQYTWPRRKVAVNPLNPAGDLPSLPASFFPPLSTSSPRTVDLHLPQHPALTTSFHRHVERKAPSASVEATFNPETSIHSPRQKHSSRSAQQHNKTRTTSPNAETR